MLVAKLLENEDGASLIEYSLLLGLISLTILTAIASISGSMAVMWSNAASVMATAA